MGSCRRWRLARWESGEGPCLSALHAIGCSARCFVLLELCCIQSATYRMSQVKRVYMKANLLVHPDKVRQRSGTPEQVAIADMVFDVLKEAWGLFKP